MKRRELTKDNSLMTRKVAEERCFLLTRYHSKISPISER
jgi:hypothetical protein